MGRLQSELPHLLCPEQVPPYITDGDNVMLGLYVASTWRDMSYGSLYAAKFTPDPARRLRGAWDCPLLTLTL
jgi:hypothetical protein